MAMLYIETKKLFISDFTNRSLYRLKEKGYAADILCHIAGPVISVEEFNSK